MNETSFDGLSSSKFEEFCFDLLHASGFVNVDWRKGTGLATSPADKGRDIVCDHPRSEPDGRQYFERWFVACKHFKKACRPRSSRTCSHGPKPIGPTSLYSRFQTSSVTRRRSTWSPTERTTRRTSRYGIGRSPSLCACYAGSSRCSGSTTSPTLLSEA